VAEEEDEEEEEEEEEYPVLQMFEEQSRSRTAAAKKSRRPDEGMEEQLLRAGGTGREKLSNIDDIVLRSKVGEMMEVLGMQRHSARLEALGVASNTETLRWNLEQGRVQSIAGVCAKEATLLVKQWAESAQRLKRLNQPDPTVGEMEYVGEAAVPWTTVGKKKSSSSRPPVVESTAIVGSKAASGKAKGGKFDWWGDNAEEEGDEDEAEWCDRSQLGMWIGSNQISRKRRESSKLYHCWKWR
jgi:hypothetical protein